MINNSNRLGYIEGWLATIANLILFFLKLWVGMVFGSVAMVADAWHTLSDSFTSIVVIIGFWVSGRPADEEHPFGHGRAEGIAAIVIATLLIVVGCNFFLESINRLRNQQAAAFGLIAIAVFAFSAVAKEALAQFSFWAGKKIKAQSLMADAWHHRSDAIASALIVIGIGIGKIYWWIDGVMGIGVSLLILFAAGKIIKDSSASLMGQKPDRELEQKVKALVERVAPEAVELHHFHAHGYGAYTEITLHLRLPSKMDVSSAHGVGQRIEDTIRRELGIEATVHIEPRKD